LDKIAEGIITPTVATAPMKDLDKVLKDLDDGKVKGRIVLVPEGVAS
jgi:D-arabinose 1-dehydrogenase-like Zn-dependent alcohol dehydrogenase